MRDIRIGLPRGKQQRQGFSPVTDCRPIRYNEGMPSPPRLRFLVAEDNEQWRNIIVHTLEVDYDFAGVVERGDQIIETAKQLHPDVITLDVSMPGQSGLNALPGLRAVLPAAIIIVVSATAFPLYMQEASVRGADGYIQKGSACCDLIKTIESVRDSRPHI